MSKKLSMRVATHALIAGLVFTSGGYGAVALAADGGGAAAAATTKGTPTTPPAAGVYGSLTVHKRLDSSTLGTPTGKDDSNVGGKEFNGVHFVVKKVKADLTTNAGLKAAAALTPDTAEIDDTFAARDVPTTGHGTATFPNLPVGVYLVTETDPDSATKTKAGLDKDSTVKPATPFLAFIPMTDTSDTSKWNYDVVAYPKNNSFTVKKALAAGTANQNANVGDDITYDITGDRPTFDPNKQYIGYYQLIDNKPAGFTFESVSVKIGDTVLSEGADYTVTNKTSGDPTVTLTVGGETKLMDAAHKSDKVVASFVFTVDSFTPGKDGSYERTNLGHANVQVKNRPEGNTPSNPKQPDVPPVNPGGKTPDTPNPNTPPKGVTPTPSNPVKDTWIPVKITKVKAGDDNTKLGGATFNVYRCTAKSADHTANGDEGVIAQSEQPITIKHGSSAGVKDFTTSSESKDLGTVTIDALRLRVEGTQDNRKPTDGYCLKEIKAPAGYEKNPEPIFFRLDANKKNEVLDLKIEDTPSVAPKLPATGGMGVGLLMALGSIVVGAGAFFARRSSKAEA